MGLIVQSYSVFAYTLVVVSRGGGGTVVKQISISLCILLPFPLFKGRFRELSLNITFSTSIRNKSHLCLSHHVKSPTCFSNTYVHCTLIVNLPDTLHRCGHGITHISITKNRSLHCLNQSSLKQLYPYSQPEKEPWP